MAPTLYMISGSPPVRSVQITAKAIGLQLVEKVVNIIEKEQLKPNYLKINPQHTVPTLVEDDGFTLWDSHAINAYLVQKYGKDDALYPKDLKKRALVDQRLHFDSGVAFATIVKIMTSAFTKKTINNTCKESADQVYSFLEAFLESKKWICGESVTIADYNLYTSVTSLNVLVAINAQKYSKVAAWLKTVDDLPETEVSKKGLAAFEGFIKKNLS